MRGSDEEDEEDELAKAIKLSSDEHVRQQQRILNEIISNRRSSSPNPDPNPGLPQKPSNPFLMTASLFERPIPQKEPKRQSSSRALGRSLTDESQKDKEKQFTDSLYAKFQIDSPSQPADDSDTADDFVKETKPFGTIPKLDKSYITPVSMPRSSRKSTTLLNEPSEDTFSQRSKKTVKIRESRKIDMDDDDFQLASLESTRSIQAAKFPDRSGLKYFRGGSIEPASQELLTSKKPIQSKIYSTTNAVEDKRSPVAPEIVRSGAILVPETQMLDFSASEHEVVLIDKPKTSPARNGSLESTLVDDTSDRITPHQPPSLVDLSSRNSNQGFAKKNKTATSIGFDKKKAIVLDNVADTDDDDDDDEAIDLTHLAYPKVKVSLEQHPEDTTTIPETPAKKSKTPKKSSHLEESQSSPIVLRSHKPKTNKNTTEHNNFNYDDPIKMPNSDTRGKEQCPYCGEWVTMAVFDSHVDLCLSKELDTAPPRKSIASLPTQLSFETTIHDDQKASQKSNRDDNTPKGHIRLSQFSKVYRPPSARKSHEAIEDFSDFETTPKGLSKRKAQDDLEECPFCTMFYPVSELQKHVDSKHPEEQIANGEDLEDNYIGPRNGDLEGPPFEEDSGSQSEAESENEQPQSDSEELSPLEDFVNLRELREKGQLGRFAGYYQQFDAIEKKRGRRKASASQDSDDPAPTQRKGTRKPFAKKKWGKSSQSSQRRKKALRSNFRSMKAPK
ncbi:hypothetical protein HDV05_005404 [Chytridiales sp. JEL 0842]|nr:hypothetical protein HDV05_005404 [Chytridiales sp. JEL 0842]